MAVEFSGSADEPWWRVNGEVEDPLQMLFAYIARVWIAEHPVPIAMPELADFSLSDAIKDFREYADVNGTAELHGPLTLEQSWKMGQLVAGEELICLVSLDAPDLDRLNIELRLATLRPRAVLEVAAEVLAADESASCHVMFDESQGHVLGLKSYDAESDRFFYHDPWPGRSLLEKYLPEGEVQPAPGLVRQWTIPARALAGMLHSIVITRHSWDVVHGRAQPHERRQPVTISLEDLNRVQKSEILAFVIGCDEAGILSDQGLLGMYFVLNRGVIFDATEDGTTVIAGLRSLAERLWAQGRDPEPVLTLLLLRLGEPALTHQGTTDTTKRPLGTSAALAEAKILIGDWLTEFEDIEKAQEWFRRAVVVAPAGMTAARAMDRLGGAEQKLGHIAEAQKWLTRAAESGAPAIAPLSMVNLGHLLRRTGSAAEAADWYRRAATSDEPEAAAAGMINLGILALDNGDQASAETWFRKAVTAGHPGRAALAMAMLGGLFEDSDPIRARQWMEQAAAVSDDIQVITAARLALAKWDVAEQRTGPARDHLRWILQYSDEARKPEAALRLGWLEQGQDELTARSLFQYATHSSDPEIAASAMVELGRSALKWGDETGGNQWLGQAIATGHPLHTGQAMFVLGMHALHASRLADARTWLEQARDRSPDVAARAVGALGLVAEAENDLLAAVLCFEQAAASSDPPTAEFGRGQLHRIQEQLERDRKVATYIARKTGSSARPTTS